jgi:hypothetical protein
MTIAFWWMITFALMAQSQPSQTIQGISGGKKSSGDCGYIANTPNYVINLSEATYSLNVILDAQQGKPSLLILGPGKSDRFCVFGEPNIGKNAQMGGYWMPGQYLIYVGDDLGNHYPFTLRIINK